MVYARTLTNRERKSIKGYNLPPDIEEHVRTIWRMEVKPLVPNFIITLTGWIIAIVVGLVSAGVLWVNYFSPDLAHMQGILNFMRFILVILLPFIVVVHILRIVALERDKMGAEAFKKWALDVWCSQTGLHQKIFSLCMVALVVGLIFNGYFLTGLMSFLCFLSILFCKKWQKNTIQKTMDDIASKKRRDRGQ